jgi:lipid II:glycine glycyltransferase (peptidoglycan interpeptide bridge formation enzyme)
MLESRKLPIDKKKIVLLFSNTFNFIEKYNQGFIEYIFDGDILVGGLIIIFQGTSARYFKGVSDPERRDMPIMHVGIFEAIKYCKMNGYLTFDLWGYNHFVDERDQVFYINRFKKGFSGNFTFYPKRMNFELRPGLYNIYIIFKFIKTSIDKLLLKII